MNAYRYFASYYDKLTKNISYKKLADYLIQLLAERGCRFGLTVDLACGTGSLLVELAKRGIDVIGVDASEEMLSVAQQKFQEEEKACPLLLHQRMQDLDLYGTVDTMLCTLDSINHLKNSNEILSMFHKVSLFLNPNGYFIFDVNTIYKHKEILSDHSFVYEMEDLFCVWQNHFNGEDNSVTITLDFFELVGSVYQRKSECFKEFAYSEGAIESLLEKADLRVVCKYNGFSFGRVYEESERIIYVVQKIKPKKIYF